MKACHHCGTELALSGPVGRTQGCPTCYSDLKCCLNCGLFDPGVSQQCREPQVELVGDKAKANFCEFFVFSETSGLGRLGGDDASVSRDRARSALEALFKKS
jgi:hypothetical protein